MFNLFCENSCWYFTTISLHEKFAEGNPKSCRDFHHCFIGYSCHKMYSMPSLTSLVPATNMTEQSWSSSSNHDHRWHSNSTHKSSNPVDEICKCWYSCFNNDICPHHVNIVVCPHHINNVVCLHHINNVVCPHHNNNVVCPHQTKRISYRENPLKQQYNSLTDSKPPCHLPDCDYDSTHDFTHVAESPSADDSCHSSSLLLDLLKSNSSSHTLADNRIIVLPSSLFFASSNGEMCHLPYLALLICRCSQGHMSHDSRLQYSMKELSCLAVWNVWCVWQSSTLLLYNSTIATLY